MAVRDDRRDISRPTTIESTSFSSCFRTPSRYLLKRHWLRRETAINGRHHPRKKPHRSQSLIGRVIDWPSLCRVRFSNFRRSAPHSHKHEHRVYSSPRTGESVVCFSTCHSRPLAKGRRSLGRNSDRANADYIYDESFHSSVCPVAQLVLFEDCYNRHKQRVNHQKKMKVQNTALRLLLLLLLVLSPKRRKF